MVATNYFIVLLAASAFRGECISVSPARVSATVGNANQNAAQAELGYNGKFLIASFPDLTEVAYCQLPDNVWRPLVIGHVTSPGGVAVDNARMRLYLADPPNNKIYWYQLVVKPDGLLETDNNQHVAVEGYKVYWMSLNTQGDLYFTGKQTVEAPESAYDAVFRLDFEKISAGEDTDTAIEVYTRSNSGNPDPAVWMPSGIAVDSFSIYWGNQEEGARYGSVVKAPRMNLASSQTSVARGAMQLSVLFNDQPAVKGITATNNNVFFLTTDGIWGVPKTRTGGATNGLNNGLISGPPSQNGGNTWDPRSITFDNDATMYFTDHLYGKVYSLPAVDTFPHTPSLFSAAPDVYGIALFDTTTNQDAGVRSALAVTTVIAAALSLVNSLM